MTILRLLMSRDNMFLHIDTVKIPCRVEKAQGKALNFRFKPNEPVLIIRTPNGKLTPAHHQAIEKHKNWILKHYAQSQVLYARREDFLKHLAAGKILYMGEMYKLIFRQGKNRQVRVEDEQIIISVTDQMVGDRKEIIYQALRALAKDHIQNRTTTLGEWTDSSFGQIRVKDVRSKWGSCSSKRNLNFNWHLIFLPPTLIDYIIIHELMHLREMNHSPAFWAWVQKFYPSYKEAEKAIRSYEWLIGIMET